MKEYDPRREAVLRQAGEIIERAREDILQHFDLYIYDTCRESYAAEKLIVPPMLEYYSEYCREEQLPLDILGWIEQEREHHIIPNSELTEIEAIGVIIHVITRLQRVKDQQAKVQALTEARGLKDLLMQLSPHKARILAQIFGRHVRGILEP